MRRTFVAIAAAVVAAGLVVGVIGAGLSSCVTPRRAWKEPPGRQLLAGPYTMYVAPRSAIVAFRDTSGLAARVTWQSETGESGSVPAERAGDLYSATLTELPVGPKISYRVLFGEREKGAGTLHMGPSASDGRFRFAVFGDTRTNHQVHRAVIEKVAKEDISFYLHSGDMVERGGIYEQWITFFQIERDLMEKATIIPAIGNHDLGNRGYYSRYFFLDRWSNGRSFFVTDYGNLRIVSLDQTIICEEQCAQYEFVRSALEEGAKQGKLMVMFMHHPSYSSGDHGSDLTLRATIQRLTRTYGVELVMQGHDHHYERTKPQDGTTFVVSGSAGAPIDPVNPQPFTAEARTEPHYVLVDVDGDKMSMRAVNLRGEVFDSAVIENNPPGGRREQPSSVSAVSVP